MKVLLVSIAFPPKSDPESLQTGRYVKYLVKLGCSVTVITSSLPTLYMEEDVNLTSHVPQVSRMHSVKLFENRYVNFIVRKFFPSWLQYPDSKWSFYTTSIPKMPKPDVLYSRSYPLSSTLLALRIKKKIRTPWILHLSDPWAISYEGDSPATAFKPKPRQWNLRKERECFALADKISFTSDKTLELYQSVYPEFAHKFIVTPNVLDEDSSSNQPIDFSGKLRIVYTGGFGEKRSPVFFLETITEFLTEFPTVRPHLEFVFMGPMTRYNSAVFAQYSSTNEIRHLGVVPYGQMLKHQRSAHVLVNIDTDIPLEKHAVFFPSKLLEYFAASRRVLNISNHHSLSTAVIKNKFGDCVEFRNKSALKKILHEYWQRFQNQDAEYFSTKQSVTEYEAGFNASLLKEQMEQLIRNSHSTAV